MKSNIIICISISFAISSISSAALVSYVFSSQNAPTTTSTGSSTGVLGSPSDIWGGLGRDSINTTISNLVDVDGLATSLDFVSTGFDLLLAGDNEDGEDNLNGAFPIINNWFARSSAPPSFTFSGFLPTDTVDLVLYANHHFPSSLTVAFPNRGANFTIDGVTEANTGASGTQTSLIQDVNYVRFTGLKADSSGEIVVDISIPDDFAYFNGFQLNVVPEPSTSLFVLTGLITGLVRRRK